MKLARAAFNHSVSAEYRKCSSEKASAIKKKTHIPHILAVKTGFVIDLQLIASADLRPSGKPRLYIVCAVSVAFLEQIVLGSTAPGAVR